MERKLRKEKELANITKLRMENSKGCVPTVSGVDLDTSWQTMATDTPVATAAFHDTNKTKNSEV